MKIATDLVQRGHRIAIPFGEDWDFDLILFRDDQFERVQVKYARSNGVVLGVKCGSHSLTNGRVRATKQYTAETIDWIGVYDASTDACFYVPARLLGTGRSMIYLRLREPRNNQIVGVNFADDFRQLGDPPGVFDDGASRIRTDGLRVANATL
jgi:PD-(D/E)XK nuclease superfamily protein